MLFSESALKGAHFVELCNRLAADAVAAARGCKQVALVGGVDEIPTGHAAAMLEIQLLDARTRHASIWHRYSPFTIGQPTLAPDTSGR